MGATLNWNVFDTGFPADGKPRDKLELAVRYATLAPPERQWQPWEIRVSDRFAELSANDDSTVEALDVEGRETMISCGASLQYLKLALKHYGCLGRVELFPDLDRPRLAARIHIGCSGDPDSLEAQLFEAMKLRGMDSRSSGESPVPEVMLDVLSRAGAGERAWLEFARNESSRRRLLDLASARGRLQVNELRFQNETLVRSTDRRWESSGFVSTRLHERFSRWRRPFLAVKVDARPAASHASHEGSEPGELAGTWSVLKTKTDDGRGWLAAGQTMARLVLHARSLGLICSFFSDVLQRPGLRSELRTTIGHKGFAQVILRFGAAQMEAFVQPNVRYQVTATDASV